MSQVNAVKAAKQSLRKLISSKLTLLSKDQINLQSTSVLEKVQRTQAFVDAKSIALYMSMPNIEIDTLELIRHCFKEQKTVFLPACCDENEKPTKTMRFLKVNSFDEVENLQPRGKYKLREPISGEDVMLQGNLDLIIVPGVAFTNEGYRIGHGAGYYDRFLSCYYEKFKNRPYLIGVGLIEQRVESLPIESHDWRLDEVVFGN